MKDNYDDYENGKLDGYNEGYADGFKDGKNDAEDRQRAQMREKELYDRISEIEFDIQSLKGDKYLKNAGKRRMWW